jgi:hypothetical protein
MRRVNYGHESTRKSMIHEGSTKEDPVKAFVILRVLRVHGFCGCAHETYPLPK